MNKKLSQSWLAYLFLTPALLAMAVLVFYPLILGTSYSFTDMNQYNMGNQFVAPSWKWVGLANYRKLLGNLNSEFWDVALNTLIWTFTNVFFHFVIGLFLALLLNRKLKGRAIYRMLMLIPWAVPSFVSAFSWKWMFNAEYGIINLMLGKLGIEPIAWLSNKWTAMFAVIITNIWLGVPFMMVTLLGGLQSIPRELYEAAEVDGASKWQQFLNITLPLLKPVAFTATLLGVIWTFNMFNVIYLITGGGPYKQTEILVTYAYREAFMNWNFGISATYGVIILSFLLAFSFFYNRLLKNAGEKVYY
ncbi:carbohydrate ABC transporter permease [Carboxydocella sp. ULO1]|uniref:carbohydrate ABC transporter permease n=1 Tax=Carboxydocella sp. ULO1 TaxID=1926599 RepID=UPI0009AF1F50|nr:sugar ABC transporter permease [Carboxydocella sp. ULO1]GAW29791.1 ABC transporter permease [Carboxydocella sp. ULO1]